MLDFMLATTLLATTYWKKEKKHQKMNAVEAFVLSDSYNKDEFNELTFLTIPISL